MLFAWKITLSFLLKFSLLSRLGKWRKIWCVSLTGELEVSRGGSHSCTYWKLVICLGFKENTPKRPSRWVQKVHQRMEYQRTPLLGSKFLKLPPINLAGFVVLDSCLEQGWLWLPFAGMYFTFVSSSFSGVPRSGRICGVLGAKSWNIVLTCMGNTITIASREWMLSNLFE